MKSKKRITIFVLFISALVVLTFIGRRRDGYPVEIGESMESVRSKYGELFSKGPELLFLWAEEVWTYGPLLDVSKLLRFESPFTFRFFSFEKGDFLVCFTLYKKVGVAGFWNGKRFVRTSHYPPKSSADLSKSNDARLRIGDKDEASGSEIGQCGSHANVTSKTQR